MKLPGCKIDGVGLFCMWDQLIMKLFFVFCFFALEQLNPLGGRSKLALLKPPSLGRRLSEVPVIPSCPYHTHLLTPVPGAWEGSGFSP